MSWTWDEINAVWFRGTVISDPAPQVWVELFNVVDSYFGRAWIDAQRFQHGVESWGQEPAAYVLSQGLRLRCLNAVTGSDKLIEKLRRHDSAAWAELTAIYLLTSGDQGVEVEVEPHPPGTSRVPDLAVRRTDDPWTYVEVTQPNTSVERKQVERILARLTRLLETVDGRYAVEVFLRRVPSPDEIAAIEDRLPLVVRSATAHVDNLPDGLGRLFLNESTPGHLALIDHDEEYHPRLGRMSVRIENDVPQRHIAIRLAYTDSRADAFLRSEARQLVKGTPGLIMIHTAGAAGAFRSWEEVLIKRLRPRQHTRVSAIALFQSGMAPTPHGEAWEPEVRLITNPHAAYPLPEWIQSALRRFPPKS